MTKYKDYPPQGTYHLLLKRLGQPNASANQQAARANIGVGAPKPLGGSDDETAITGNDEGYYNPGEPIPGLGATLQGHNFIERVEIKAENKETAIMTLEEEKREDDLLRLESLSETREKQSDINHEVIVEEAVESQNEAVLDAALSPSY